MHDYEHYIYVLNNKKLQLTVLENKMLNILIENKGKVVTYDVISENVYSIKYDSSVKISISNLICRLRKKGIEIHTVRAIGFMIE